MRKNQGKKKCVKVEGKLSKYGILKAKKRKGFAEALVNSCVSSAVEILNKMETENNMEIKGDLD